MKKARETELCVVGDNLFSETTTTFRQSVEKIGVNLFSMSMLSKMEEGGRERVSERERERKREMCTDFLTATPVHAKLTVDR